MLKMDLLYTGSCCCCFSCKGNKKNFFILIEKSYIYVHFIFHYFIFLFYDRILYEKYSNPDLCVLPNKYIRFSSHLANFFKDDCRKNCINC